MIMTQTRSLPFPAAAIYLTALGLNEAFTAQPQCQAMYAALTKPPEAQATGDSSSSALSLERVAVGFGVVGLVSNWHGTEQFNPQGG